MSWGAKYRYDSYTWPEIKEKVKEQPVVILPVGSVEDHGHHLPLDVDDFCIWSVCEAAAKRLDGEVLLLPLVPYGFEDHHMEFPGTITIKPKHLEDFVHDITTSVAHHGFKKVLIGDGHGSNMPILEMAARRTVLDTDAHCGLFAWWSLIAGIIPKVRKSEIGGMSHACELETAVYLHLDSGRVQMDKARKEIGLPFDNPLLHGHDMQTRGALVMMDWWSRFSKTGVVGDPTVATAETGKVFFEGAVENLVKMVRDFKAYPIKEREDMH